VVTSVRMVELRPMDEEGMRDRVQAEDCGEQVGVREAHWRGVDGSRGRAKRGDRPVRPSESAKGAGSGQA
jgi:hypothetical protein